MAVAFLPAALRRLRLQAALAHSRQSSKLTADDVTQLAAQLIEAQEQELAARLGGGGDLPVDRLIRWLPISPLDLELLLVAVALEIDPTFAMTVSALAGEEPRAGITPKLVAQILGLGADEALRLRLDARHPFVRVGLLATTPASIADTVRPWRAAARAASFLAGENVLDPAFATSGGVVPFDDVFDLGHVAAQLELLERALATDDIVVIIEGPEGAGRRTLAAAAARRYRREAVALDLGAAAGDPVRLASELRALRCETFLRAAIPVLARFDAILGEGPQAARVAEVVEAIDQIIGPVIVTASGTVALPELRRRTLRVKVGPPSIAARERIWQRALAPDDAHLGPAIAAVAGRYPMTPSAIVRAVANARMLAPAQEALVGADLNAGVVSVIQERFGGLAVAVEVAQRWEDLVLPQDTMDDITAFVSRAIHADRVYEQWGFRDKLQRGLGLAALFSGPPGTGKTMVAGLIARALDLELYMVDLSQVVSKWVGETEKQLGKIFDAASMGHALLLFDEADALFARRTEVKSSNDRYANLEVNYLLQRLEQFNGVAILTTNLDGSVDPAFKRRLAADVRFYAPERPEREKLWQTLLPSRTPIVGALDFRALSDAFPEMCGGHVRNAVLRAAFIAASENRGVTQDHLLRAARTEYRAMGKML
jgi:hypothetical protein